MDFDKLTDNHSSTPVPETESVGALAVATVLIGVSITLPAFLLGVEILSSLGAVKGAMALLGSAAVLTLFGAITITVGARQRLSTYAIIDRTFGYRGALLVNAILTTSLFGWFGVTAMLFGRASSAAFQHALGVTIAEWTYTLAGGLLMIITTIFGFRAIQHLSRIVVPLLAILMLTGVWVTVKGTPWSELIQANEASSGQLGTVAGAISVLIGAYMIGVVTAPDLSRFLKAESSAFMASFLGYGFGAALILYMAGLPALATGSDDLIENMISIGLGIPALIIVVFATWTTNVNNLYSASLGLANLLPPMKDWVVTLCAGIAGISLALIGILDHFVGFLILLSVAIPPIAGVYVAGSFLSGKNSIGNRPKALNVPALMSWVIGTLIAYTAQQEFIALSTVPAVDAFVAALLTYFLLSFLKVQKDHTNANSKL